MGDYGIKVTQPGYDVSTAIPNQLVFSSKYQTLKVFSQGSGTITDSGRTITVAHNLGYVPFFLVHSGTDPVYVADYVDSDDLVINPVARAITGACGISRNIIAYADTSNLYIVAQADFGYDIAWPLCDTAAYRNDNYANEDPTPATGFVEVGKTAADGLNYGAYRFLTVNVAQGTTIAKAIMEIHVGGVNGSNQVKMRIWGINEDNTAEFDTGTFATARGKTTASVDYDFNPSVGSFYQITVTSLVQEILNRAGWVSGNQLGIMLWDNGTTQDGSWYEDEFTSICGTYCANTSLRILESNTLTSYKYTIFLNKAED